MIQRGYKVVVIINLLIFMTALIGFITPSQKEWYYAMLPYYFVVSALVLMLYAQQELRKTLMDGFIVIIVATSIESIPWFLKWTHYSMYWSFQWSSFPLSIGLYWYALCYSMSILIHKIPANTIVLILVGSLITLSCHILVCIPLIKVGLLDIQDGYNWMIYLNSLLTALACMTYLMLRKPTNNPLALYYLGGIIVFFCGLISFLG